MNHIDRFTREADETNKHKKMVCISVKVPSCLYRPEHIPFDTLVRFLLQHNRLFTVVAIEQNQNQKVDSDFFEFNQTVYSTLDIYNIIYLNYCWLYYYL